MLEEVLRKAFTLAHQRLGLIFLDILWKTIWLIATVAALFLIAAWFGSGLRNTAWQDTGAVNPLIALAVLRAWWASHKTDIGIVLTVVTIFSIASWFVLEALFRCRLVA